MEDNQEQDYINRIKNGDTSCYAHLVDQYKHMAYTITLKILKNPEDAEDSAQESFIKAFQQIHQFEGKSKFSTWLYTIVYRTAISKLRENKIETYSINDSIRENYPADRITQLEQLQVQDDQHYVRQAIQDLPRTEALLVTLFYINENSIREIQEITGFSFTTIKIRLFRARKKLERALRFLIDYEMNVK